MQYNGNSPCLHEREFLQCELSLGSYLLGEQECAPPSPWIPSHTDKYTWLAYHP